MKRTAATFISLLLLGIASATAAVPRVDASFGTGGSVRTLVGATTESASGVALMGDGRVVIAGNVQTQVAGASDLVTTVPAVGVVRLLADGTRDAAFGVNGQVVVQVPDVANGKLVATDVAVQADGKVVVLISRNTFVTPDAAPVLMRLTPAGTLDTAFGNGGFLSVTGIFARAMVVQPDDKIVLGGSAKLTPESTESFALARYDAAGNADAAFGTMGVAIMNPAYGEGRVNAIAVAADGRLAVAGYLVNLFAVGMFTASGAPDATFAGIGVVVTGYSTSAAHGVTFQADGRIVATGHDRSEGPYGTFSRTPKVVRYQADGFLDTSFGTNGYQTYNVDSLALGTHPQFRASDGTITLNVDRGILRVTATGAVDTTFGTNGLVIPPNGSGPIGPIQTTFSALVARPDGRLVPVGARDGGYAVTSYLADGTPDASFAVAPTGAVQLDTGAPITFRAIARHADGRIVAAGNRVDRPGYVGLAGITAGGTPDASFGGDGRVFTRAFGALGFARVVIPLADGKVVVAGSSAHFLSDPYALALARFDAHGALDTTFGASGVSTIATGTGMTVLTAAARQPDGHIVVAGANPNLNPLYLARVTADGMPDTTFGTNGLVTLSMSATLNAVAILGDGRILAAGRAAMPGNDFLLMRFTSAGAPDPTFGSGGTVLVDFGASDDRAIAMVVLDTGRILVGGVSNAAGGTGLDFVVARFLADGSLDATFGEAGKRFLVPTTGDDYLEGMAVLPDGRILLAGNTQTGTIAMASLDADGTPTARFGTAGLAALPWSSELPLRYLSSMAALPDGKVVIASGSASFGGTGRITRLLVSPTTRGDASGDAKADLFWRDAGTGLSWWSMDGAAILGTAFANVGAEWQISDVADLDGDGKADLLWRNTGSGALYAWRLDGLVPAGYWDLGTPGAGWTPVGAADFDGNGTADVLFRHADGTLYAWLMQGGTIASQGVIGTAPANATIVDLVDVIGHGKAGIVWRRTTDGEVFHWLMDGLMHLGGQSMGTADPALWTLIAADDFNGDGKADLLWRATTGEAYVWLMNGATVLSTGSLGNPGGAWSIRAVADFTGDGKADLLWRHTDGSGYLWTLSGTTITAAVPVANPGGAWQVVAP